jgi:hypothetical protein
VDGGILRQQQESAAGHAERTHTRVTHDLQPSFRGESAEQPIASVKKSVEVQRTGKQQPGGEHKDSYHLQREYQTQADFQSVEDSAQRQANEGEKSNGAAEFLRCKAAPDDSREDGQELESSQE